MMKKNKKEDNKVNRIQKRLFEKQLKVFGNTFSRFSLFQLEEISKLINDLIERKKKNV